VTDRPPLAAAIVDGDAYAEQGSERFQVATMLATMMRRRGD
jgi:hypothetical protein